MKSTHVQEHTPTATRAVTDPVCGMGVNPPDAFGSHDYAGQTCWFYSSQCLEKFRSEPSKYATLSSESSQSATSRGAEKTAPAMAAEYTCPMHPEVRQLGIPS